VNRQTENTTKGEIMSRALATKTAPAEALEQVIAQGNLAQLSPEERTQYYARLCDSLGLNPLTRPFEYLTLNGKLTLYARKDATDQLRNLRGVSIQIVSREQIGDVYVVTARATDRSQRSDESIGAVAIGSLKGDALCNAIMKAETKSKRRVTLSICGLGLLDESELETVPVAAPFIEQPQQKALPAVNKQQEMRSELCKLNERLKFSDAQLLAWLIKRFELTDPETLDAALASLSDEQLSQAIDTFQEKLTQ
jgi:hypothetical protein